MTAAERAQRLSGFGFTEPQASFLVTVMLHAGVCVERQYCEATGRVRGNSTRRFFTDLVARRHATVHPAGRPAGRLYHLHARPLYDAIGEPNNRHRRPMMLSRAVERLMVLDAVLATPDVEWLATEHDKLAYFTAVTPVDRALLPQLVFSADTARTVRYFPDKLPIGVHRGGRLHEFLYAVHRASPGDFRVFLYRHLALFRAIGRWAVRLLVPPHLEPFKAAYEQAAHEELGIRLAPRTMDELQWFFHERRRVSMGTPVSDPERFRRARRAFGAPRYRVLYRHWLTAGDGCLDVLGSPLLSDAVERGFGRIETEVVRRPYHHFSTLVGTS